VQFPDGPATVSVLSAQTVLDQLPSGSETTGAGDRVRITGVQFGTDEFDTDRGLVRLPSWRFSSPALPGPLILPALPRDVLWPWPTVPLPAEQRVYLPLRQATVDPTGTVLTVILLKPKPPCSNQPTYRHDPVLTQTPSVVVVGMARVLADPQPTIPPNTPCDASLGWRGDKHLIRLTSPLGNRPVVSEDGWPLIIQDQPPR